MSHANAKRVLITGSSGRIGRVLVEALKSAYMVLEADLPKHDLRNSDVCERLVKDSGIDVIIHLAWDTTAENWRSQRVAPGNWRMAENILLSAKKHHIPRVILASSVHVHPYRNSPASDGSLIDSHADCIPTSPYGAHKLSIEKLGLWHSKEGLEVICVRFGGVSKPATPPRDHRIVGLTHEKGVSPAYCRFFSRFSRAPAREFEALRHSIPPWFIPKSRGRRRAWSPRRG
jgi:nucleoside-diphosphate-sugar epimerase